MRVAIIGGGPSGRSIERAMTDRGISAQLLSRSTGFDVFDPAAAKHLGQMDAVVEATGHFTTKKGVATDLFTRSTRAVTNLVGETGASKHILLSIVNCDKPEVQEYGYFAGKAEQERTARAENATIVRSTQWFEFAEQNLNRLKFGPLALVPSMTIKPVALDAVADVITECVLGDRSGRSYDVAGPEVMTLWEMTKRIRGKGHPVPVPLPIPGATGRAFRAGAMVRVSKVEQIGPRFSEWLSARNGGPHTRVSAAGSLGHTLSGECNAAASGNGTYRPSYSP